MDDKIETVRHAVGADIPDDEFSIQVQFREEAFIFFPGGKQFDI